MGRKRRSKEFKNNSQVIDIEEARRQRLEKRQAEREQEEEKIRYAASQKTRGKMAIRRARNRKRAMIAFLCVFIAGVVGFSLIKIVSLKREQRDVIQQQQELEAEKAQLEKELADINDPTNLEEQARDQLRLIKPGEYLYMFPEEITQSGAGSQETEEQEPGEE